MFRPVRKLIFIVGVVVAFYAGVTFEKARVTTACSDGRLSGDFCLASDIPND